MERNQWNRDALEHKIELWREQRAQKMAARLQLNSSKPRTISSNVLGNVNYRQPMTVQPGLRQHGSGPRFIHVDQRWNPNYNDYGYREHHSPHKQYHHADHRNHGYGQGSYHQQHGPKKGGHFSSHKSLYNNRKPTNKPNKRYSTSCSNISNTTEVENQNVVCPQEQASGIKSDNAVPSSSSENNVNALQVNSDYSENVAAVMEDVDVNIEQEVEKASDSDKRIQESSNKRYSSSCNISNTTEVENQNVICPQEQTSGITSEKAVPSSSSEINVNALQVNSDYSENVTDVEDVDVNIEQEVEKASDSDESIQERSVPESDRLQDNTVCGTVGNLQMSELTENHLHESQALVDGCVPAETDIINDVSVLEPAMNSPDEVPTSFADASSTIPINIENSDDITVVDTKTISESQVEVNDHETFEQVIVHELIDIDKKELSEGTDVKLVSKLVVTVSETSTTAYECTDVNSETETNVEEISAIEQMASSETNSDAINETLDLELNLSLKSEIEIVEDMDDAVDPLNINAETASNEHSNNEVGIGGSCAGTSYSENSAIFPVALIVAGDSDTEGSIIRYDDISLESDNDLSKEIERVENKLANISIVNKEDAISEVECATPMKRERRQVLLDATNILPSSIIKFAVREVRRNEESEITVTPVRRSARLSTLTPVSTHKNVCVQKLEELSPEVREKMKFVQNPAIDNMPEC